LLRNSPLKSEFHKSKPKEREKEMEICYAICVSKINSEDFTKPHVDTSSLPGDCWDMARARSPHLIHTKPQGKYHFSLRTSAQSQSSPEENEIHWLYRTLESALELGKADPDKRTQMLLALKAAVNSLEGIDVDTFMEMTVEKPTIRPTMTVETPIMTIGGSPPSDHECLQHE